MRDLLVLLGAEAAGLLSVSDDDPGNLPAALYFSSNSLSALSCLIMSARKEGLIDAHEALSTQLGFWLLRCFLSFRSTRADAGNGGSSTSAGGSTPPGSLELDELPPGANPFR